MNDKDEDLLRQIAIDVAVIKSEIQDIKELKTEVKQLKADVRSVEVDLTELKTHMKLVRWASSSTILAFIGYVSLKLFKIIL